MKNTGKIQVAHGPGFLARPLHSKKVAEAGQRCRCKKASRPRRPTPALPRGPRGVSLLPLYDGPQNSGRCLAGFQGPVSAFSDFMQRVQCDLSWALAILH